MNKKFIEGGGSCKNGKRTQWQKVYDKDGKEIDFSKHNDDWFEEYGEPACENKRINMNKKLIRLTENDLHRIVKESVNRILMESKGLDPSKRDSEFASNIKWDGEPDMDKAHKWRMSQHKANRGDKKVKGDTSLRDFARKQNQKGNFLHKRFKDPAEWAANAMRESMNRIIKESIGEYYWSISELRNGKNGEWEVYGCLEDSSESDDGWQRSFDTPEEAYNDGLNQLKYYNDGHYRLDVYTFTENGAGDYVTGVV